MITAQRRLHEARTRVTMCLEDVCVCISRQAWITVSYRGSDNENLSVCWDMTRHLPEQTNSPHIETHSVNPPPSLQSFSVYEHDKSVFFLGALRSWYEKYVLCNGGEIPTMCGTVGFHNVYRQHTRVNLIFISRSHGSIINNSASTARFSGERQIQDTQCFITSINAFHFYYQQCPQS